MNRLTTALLLAALTSPMALASDPGPDGPHGNKEGRPHREGPQKAELGLRILRLDRDHNGELTQAEIDDAKAHALARASEHIGPRTDTNGDGVLSTDELAVIESKIDDRFADIAERFAEVYAKALERFDANSDGLLEPSELPDPRQRGKGRRGEQGQQGDRERGPRDLSRIDTDGDGEISDDEKAAARVKMESARRKFRAIGALDADKSRSIDEAELAQGLKLVSQGDPSADYNGDGQVTAEDASALIEFVENPPQRPEGRDRPERRGKRQST